jgi:predicted GNAT superfamily acetyltransferase
LQELNAVNERRETTLTMQQLTHPAGAATVLGASPIIRRVETIDEYRQCESLQDRIWGRDGVARVPLLDLLTAQENGGLVLGAFERQTLVGFVYSFLGMAAGRVKHCSVVLAVDPRHRGHGIGRWLKLAQRDEVLAQGLDLITWTFDPLLAVNARLNISRLGAVARVYRVNHYGADTGLVTGLDTDRLVVEWRLRDRPDAAARPIAVPAPQATSAAGAASVAEVVQVAGLSRIVAVDPHADAPELLLPIPTDLEAMLRSDLALVRHWRCRTRELFQTCFERGYHVSGFDTAAGPAGTGCYLLRRDGVR